MGLQDTLKHLENAKSAAEVFGKLTGTKEDQLEQLKKAFHALAKATHRDKFPAKLHETADKAFASLNNWNELAISEINSGEYGVEKPLIISFQKFKFFVGKKRAEGDLAEIFACREDKTSKPLVLKLAKESAVNELIKNEAKVLITITSNDGPFKKLCENHICGFNHSFEVGGRQANVLPFYEEAFTLEQVLTAYPKGVPPKAAAWMFRRLLSALAVVHDTGYVHGAVNPANFMIFPENHNGKLIDFCYTVKIGEKLKYLVPKYKHLYPPEVTSRKEVFPQTDIYMAAGSIISVLGATSVPKKIRSFLSACLIENPFRRPKSAIDLFSEFGEVLEELYGGPKFEPFEMYEHQRTD